MVGSYPPNSERETNMSNEINFTINVCVDADELKKEVEEYLAESWNSDVDSDSIKEYARKCAKWKAEKAFQEAITEKLKELIKADEISNFLIPNFKRKLKDMSLSEMLLGIFSWKIPELIALGKNPYLEFLKFTDEQKNEIRDAIYNKALTTISDWDKYDLDGLLELVLDAVLGRKE